jgi:hypothetical protein
MNLDSPTRGMESLRMETTERERQLLNILHLDYRIEQAKGPP